MICLLHRKTLNKNGKEHKDEIAKTRKNFREKEDFVKKLTMLNASLMHLWIRCIKGKFIIKDKHPIQKDEDIYKKMPQKTSLYEMIATTIIIIELLMIMVTSTATKEENNMVTYFLHVKI